MITSNSYRKGSAKSKNSSSSSSIPRKKNEKVYYHNSNNNTSFRRDRIDNNSISSSDLNSTSANSLYNSASKKSSAYSCNKSYRRANNTVDNSLSKHTYKRKDSVSGKAKLDSAFKYTGKIDSGHHKYNEKKFVAENGAASESRKHYYEERENRRNKFFGAQVNMIDVALKKILNGVFGRHLPADLLLAEFFKNTKQCGSRDRAAMSAGVYAVLRFWGIIRNIIPEDIRALIEAGQSEKISDSDINAILISGLICEGEHSEMASNIAELYNFTISKELPGKKQDWLVRALAAAEFTASKTDIDLEMLVPTWVKSVLPDNFNIQSWLKTLTIRPPLWLRLQGQGECQEVFDDLSNNGLNYEKSSVIPNAVAVLHGKVNLFTLNSYRNGCFEVQDIGSQVIGLVCSPKPGERWFDCCAGAGGKTLHLADLMHSKGVVIAGDIRERKLEELKHRARRGGFSNVTTKLHDGRPQRGMHQVDGLLVDAPCSGSGVWRRNPGLQWAFEQSEIDKYAERQLEILNNFYNVLKPGGILVYATCSIFEQENELVVNSFISQHPEFILEDFVNPLSKQEVKGILRINSFDANGDSLFVAKMRRRIVSND